MLRHDVTQELKYHGQVMDVAAAIADLPAGGQVGEGEKGERSCYQYVPGTVDFTTLHHGGSAK